MILVLLLVPAFAFYMGRTWDRRVEADLQRRARNRRLKEQAQARKRAKRAAR